MAKQCFVVNASSTRGLEVFDAATQDGRKKMLEWVTKLAGRPFSDNEKIQAALIMEGNFKSFKSGGYSLDTVRFGSTTHGAISVLLGTFGEPDPK